MAIVLETRTRPGHPYPQYIYLRDGICMTCLLRYVQLRMWILTVIVGKVSLGSEERGPRAVLPFKRPISINEAVFILLLFILHSSYLAYGTSAMFSTTSMASRCAPAPIF
jgi:hypothetical protein